MLMKKSAIALFVLALGWALAAGPQIAGAQAKHRYDRHDRSSHTERSSLAGVEYHNISRTWQKIDLAGKNTLVAGYASYFSTELAVSWDAFSFGGEYRHGGGTYRGIRIPDVTISPEHIEGLLDLSLKDALDKQRHTMRGWRLYLSFRF